MFFPIRNIAVLSMLPLKILSARQSLLILFTCPLHLTQ